MKILCIALLCSVPIFAQVGIGTVSPTASLDIDGDLRIRVVNEEMNKDVAKDSVLVLSRDGTVKKIEAIEIVDKALPTVLKGSFSSSTVFSISLASGSAILPFDAEDFDANDEFDTSTYTYTAGQDGIYAISVQIKATASLGVATNFGVSILRNGSIISQNSFANVGILGINATPPLRQSTNLVALSAGDTIHFEVLGDIALGTIDLFGTTTESYFTIHQVR
ncbi:hypothetical protein [Altibacter sp. HG106]|uniref:hypothetical protein n=1 Tax=Altibacter sp. HG106 TaxID=3023937 RepID=UPI002350FD5E|nr:hypothetical protein [Altibacter sp. HG106]MDC7996285.1 hypothetical protein [Altibacter sp. HG106]